MRDKGPRHRPPVRWHPGAPSGQRSKVKTSKRSMASLEEAVAPMSVTLTLEDEVDISRGDMLASTQKPPDVARQFDATIERAQRTAPRSVPALHAETHHQTLPAEVKP